MKEIKDYLDNLPTVEDKNRVASLYIEELTKYKKDLTTKNITTEAAVNEVHEQGLRGDQPRALAAIREWIADNRRPYFSLMGVAGAGKSTLIKFIVNSPEFSNKKWHLTATTNKAAANLADLVGMTASTIHSKLGLVFAAEELTQKLTRRPGFRTSFSQNDIIVVDEAGMCNKELLAEIVSCRARILFLGDPYQLPPVGEDSCCAFDLCIESGSYIRMTKVLRFDNDLLTLSIDIRKAIKDSDETFYLADNIPTGNNQIHLLDGSNDLEDFISRNNSLDDWKSTKILAWRNKVVNQYNDQVRSSLGFEEAYCVGETIANADPILSPEEEVLLPTDSELLVIEASFGVPKVLHLPNYIQDNPDKVSVECAVLKVTNDAVDFRGELFVPQGKGEVELRSILNNLASIASSCKGHTRKLAWKNYWYVKNKFHRVRYTYASTVHRAQGATYNNVVVDYKDIMRNPELDTALRCTYVAATRASTNLYLIN
jgi:hypothetical protein